MQNRCCSKEEGAYHVEERGLSQSPASDLSELEGMKQQLCPGGGVGEGENADLRAIAVEGSGAGRSAVRAAEQIR
jgi:hypothetical protein